MPRQLFNALIFTISAFGLFAQPNICIGTDATICAGDQITLEDCANFGGGATGVPYSLTQIPYNPDPFNTPNTVNLSDDQFSQAVNIGFDFCFYGNTYNQLVISSNNYVSFDIGNAGGYSPWVTTAVPNPGSPETYNSILGPWQDINPGIGGIISYATYGTAPNRRFVITWSNVPMFSCTGILYSSQIKLYETSNNLETHIVNKQICASWNGGNAVHGVHSPGGVDALTVPGRNNTQWSVSDEGYLWTPQLGVQWEDTQGNTWPYTGPTLTVTPVPIPPSDSVGYFLSAIDNCGTGMGSSDTSWITISTPTVLATGTDDICSAGIGTVTANPTAGQAPFTYSWPALGANTQTVNNLSAGTYTVEIMDAIGCIATGSVTIGDTPADYDSTFTMVSCPGGNDGTAFVEMIPPIGNLTYLWDAAAGNQTTQTAVGLSAGQYSCLITSDVGCSNSVTVTVTELPGMIPSIVNQTDVTCNSGNDGMVEVDVIQGTPSYSYSWDNSSSTSNIANDLSVGTSTCTITDANGCVVTISATLNEPAPLDITFITPNTQICPEDDIDLSVTGAGGSSPYTFTWYQDGVEIGTGATFNVDPMVTNTTYCVEISEACGSPTDQECTLIYFPTPIEPSAVPFDDKMCVPSVFEFNNTSTNASEIATTFWEFGIGNESILEQGDDSTSMYYDIVGTYDITMTVTSIYGCVYTATMNDLITVLPSPTAHFNFSSNPTTIFETTVTAQNGSSPNVVQWNWISPYSSPSGSNVENPTFTFPAGEEGIYPVTLFVTTDEGCTDSVTLNLQVVPDVLIFAPTAFTPDGDAHNQYWKLEITGIDYFDFDLFIFNRWGEIVWESHDVDVGWDGTYHGKPVQAGVYQWKVEVKNPYNDDKETYSGSFSVLR